MKPLGDRRIRARFDVIGALWGLLELTESAHVVNISTTGALVESSSPVAVDSTQSIHLTLDDRSIAVDARVRHLRRVVSADGLQRFLVGLEFVAPPLHLLNSIDRLSHSSP
jgi:hypothetical protein